jgi:hypothetical protein
LKKLCWVIEPDIRGYFDHIDRGWTNKLVRQGIAHKWFLNQGNQRTGGLRIIPKEANLFSSESFYLLPMFLLWAERWSRNDQCGDIISIRIADSFALGFQEDKDARRFQKKVLEGFSPTLH